MEKELLKKLNDVYSIQCPLCNAKWSFEIISKSKWIEKRTCGCSVMSELIENRHRLHNPSLQYPPHH